MWAAVKAAAAQTVVAGLAYATRGPGATGTSGRSFRPFCSATKTYGVDLLVDASLSVWLIEVNRNPGMYCLK